MLAFDLESHGMNVRKQIVQRVGQSLLACLIGMFVAGTPLCAQEQEPGAAEPDEAARRAEEALNAPDDAEVSSEDSVPPKRVQPSINYWDLTLKGGPLMVPIFGMSILVFCYGIERALALRRKKVIPDELVKQLGELASRHGGLDPRAAYQVCQGHSSPAATVIRAALLKVGRPQSELEHAVSQATEREANRLFANVRTIMLGISVAPLLGLLGTVQGMILAFFVTSNLDKGQDRAQMLSEGIYMALVTTFAGLSVAIPAALLAHYFEGRIQALFGEIDELLLNMLPQLERYEGKLRLKRVERGEKGGEMDLEHAIPRGAEK